MVTELSDFVYDVARYHSDNEHTVTVDLTREESFFVTSIGRVLYEGDEVTYPYLRLGLVRYALMQDVLEFDDDS